MGARQKYINMKNEKNIPACRIFVLRTPEKLWDNKKIASIYKVPTWSFTLKVMLLEVAYIMVKLNILPLLPYKW